MPPKPTVQPRPAAKTTFSLSFHVYKVAFLGFNTGTASAYGILMVLIVIILAQFYLRYLNKLKEG